VEGVTHPLRHGEKDAKHTLLKCFQARNWRMEFLCKIWLVINEELTYEHKLQKKTSLS